MDSASSRPYGRRRVTIVDVARHAGVSTAAASKVLRNAYGVSDAMRERVQRSMAELSYRPHRPARGMRGRTFTVGMMLSDIENPFFNLLSEGANEVLVPESYELLIAPGGYTARAQHDAIEALIDHQMDGLIVVAPMVGAEELAALAARIPLVLIGHHASGQLLDSVAGDDHHGAALVVDHLVGLGHRRIAFFVNDRQPADEARPEGRRLTGFLDAMQARGLGDEATLVSGLWSLDGGREAARALVEIDPRPTAVFGGADIAALGMLSEWWDLGLRVPAEFSLVGYDNARTGGLGPISLTTVDQSGRAMGTRAATLLLERIGGRTAGVHERVPPHLVVRSTSAAPPR